MHTITLPTSIHNSTGPDPAGWRCWWREQSLIDGTDWKSLLDAASVALCRLRVVHGVSSS
jgi:hypothetical protein